MKLIKDGNFSPWFRALIWATGLMLAALFYCFAIGEIMFWGVIISTAIAAIGAYSEAANTLRLKPFDNEYKKAKASYTSKDDHS